ncbi:MAG: aminoacyl-tRNA hydrolase [Bacteroidia bacterium]|nr:aminoacyl-tRNA hydrolase [Bacteroidia bacterium]
MFNKLIVRTLPHLPKKLVWAFSKRYIAGPSLDDAVSASKELNRKKIKVTIDLLGEFITNLEQAEKNKVQYLNIIETVLKSGIDGNFSLKPTMFGLLLDKEACYKNIREIVYLASTKNSFIRVDMEDSRCVDLEIELFRKLKAEFSKNVGLVYQAYLKRTLNDIMNMNVLNSKEIPVNFRLCKGIYVEPPEIAYKKYEEINKHYLEDLEYIFQNKMYVGIATHDRLLVEGSYRLIEKYKVSGNMYEFQMLYGVTPLKNSDFSNEFVFSTSRSSGPGGQNVNKVSSKVELRFDVDNSKLLSDKEKAIIRNKLQNKINNQGILIIVSQSERTQHANKLNTIEKFYQLIIKVLTPVKKRKRHKVPRKVKERRLEEKHRITEKKALRKKYKQ